MDKKRTQRILGILVIIALVIILFPLLFGKNELPTQTTNLKSPPFPDQQLSPTVAETKPVPTTSLPVESDVIPTDSRAADAHTAVPDKINLHEDQHSAEISPAIAMDLNSQADSDDPAVKTTEQLSQSSPAIVTVINDSEKSVQPDEIVNNENSIKPKKISTTKKAITAAKPHRHTQKDLVKLNSKAWVVQMGSFKDKSNARQLADTLRAAGYEAFTHEVKSSNGNIRTRVYIGPEFKQASAVKLSTKIQQEIMLHGVVVPFKPLAL